MKKPKEYYFIDGMEHRNEDNTGERSMSSLVISSNIHSECVIVIGSDYELTQRAIAVVNALNEIDP